MARWPACRGRVSTAAGTRSARHRRSHRCPTRQRCDGWGTRSRRPGAVWRRRFIPTGVGNACTSWGPTSTPTVHPQGRGERHADHCSVHTAIGSSPRAWGTHTDILAVLPAVRFIPTGVGNASRPGRARGEVPVHPHGRGERGGKAALDQVAVGSSPRAWGTRNRHQRPDVGGRFIPTGVGNALGRLDWRWRRSVHPHGRGERSSSGRLAAGTCGSSPRAWGTQLGQLDIVHDHRFIPTGVGNADRSRWAPLLSAVHPHGRGERLCTDGHLWRDRGSSPRAWGTPGAIVLSDGVVRFIPAGVGNAVATT